MASQSDSYYSPTPVATLADILSDPAIANVSNLSAMSEDEREKFLSRFGIPDSSVPSVLATMAFARNENKSVPGPYQAQLNPMLEKLFEDWVKKGQINFDPKAMTPDYDMRSWWNAMRQRDPRATYNIGPTNILFPPAFTTPYSLDFGPKSIYWKGQQ